MVNPVRNRKIGFSDEQANGGQPSVATTGPSAMVQQMAAQNFALQNGGQAPPMQGDPSGTIPPVATVAPSMGFLGGGNRVMGRYEKPQQGSSSAPTTPYMKDAADRTPQYVTNFENMPIEKQAIGWNPDGTPKYASLSDALNGNTDLQQTKKAQFKADPSQKDGGFYSWIRGLSPKKRPGKHEGETDDEYDARRTRNMQMVATFADAIRHMGNIVNTSKGAPLQVFNDPTTMLEQGRQQRKAERQKKAAADADMAYKQANMTLKERAAEADRNYKALTLGFKQQAAERQAAKDKLDADHWNKNYERLLGNDEFNQGLAKAKFDESKRHNKVSEGQGATRIALAQERNGITRARLAHTIATGGGSGKGGSLTNLSSPSGHLNRKKDLNTIEKKQITQYMIKNGYINKKNLDAWNNYINMGDAKNANDLQNYWIAYAANMEGKKGDTFRKMLKDHYMYGETSTVGQPKGATQTTQKVQQPKDGKKGGKGKGKSKNGYKNTKALGL